MAFDITKALGDIGRRTADAGEAKRELRYIPLHMIDTNPRNFYSTDGIDELADNIRLFGLMEPLLVRQEACGRYMLISGHRRRLALKKLAEEAENYPESMHEPVACMVETADDPLPGVETGGDDELRARQMAEELKLIYANADTRVMSSADTAQQVRRIRELFTGLQDLGYQFPGKMRDHVAAAAKVSATRVARLDVIEKNLFPEELRKSWKAGILQETSAYEIARRSPEVQMLVLHRVGVRPLQGMTTQQVTNCLEACEADGNRDREAREDWNKNVRSMAEASGNGKSDFSAEEYLAQMHEEDTILRELCRKNLGSILHELMFFKDEYNFDENFRQANIDRIRKNDPHSSYSVGWNANDSTGTCIDWSSKGIEVRYCRRPRFRKTWVDFYDALAGAALQAAWKQPEKVSAADTGIELYAGTPTEPGEYMTRIGVGPEETRQTATWQRLEWHTDGSWCFPKTGAPLPKGTNVFRWFKLPEV